jgi:carboxymethylenebutenolidase
MPVFIAEPDGTSRRKVIILHDIYGASDFYQDLARRFASVGYSAYLPDLFARQGALPERTREHAFARREKWSTFQSIDDIRKTIDLAQHDDPGSSKIGTVGFCMGGTLVMLMGARDERIDAGVIYYGFPANEVEDGGERFAPFDEVGRVSHPLLGFWGDQDHGVGMDNVERYREGLTSSNVTHDFTIYPGLPHGFLTFDPSSANYEGSEDSWRKMLAFYGDYLG